MVNQEGIFNNLQSKINYIIMRIDKKSNIDTCYYGADGVVRSY